MRAATICLLLVGFTVLVSSCIIVKKKDNPEELARHMYKKTPAKEFEPAPPGMVFIQQGEFLMGTHERKNYHPQEVAAFYIDRYEVTCAEYKKFIVATSRRAPSNWKDDDIPFGKENHPVTNVSLEDASAFAKWSGKRLPTAFEWEKAARGIKANTWPWGNKFDATLCNSKEAYIKGTTPVGTYLKGVSVFGCFDMAGNVWEWTTDEYNPPPDKSTDPTIYDMWSKTKLFQQLPELINKRQRQSKRLRFNPPRKKIEYQKDDPYKNSPRLFMLRGGSWDSSYLDTRTYSIIGLPKDFKHGSVGFRCALDAITWRPRRPR